MVKSVGNYRRETELAGRDGLPVHCRLYSVVDEVRQAELVADDNWQANLATIGAFAAAQTCRHIALGARSTQPCATMCDNCLAAAGGARDAAAVDATGAARGAIAALQAAGGRATIIQLCAKWRDAAAEELGEAGRHCLLGAMLRTNILQLVTVRTRHKSFGYLAPGPRVTELESGVLRVALPPLSTARSDAAPARAAADERRLRAGAVDGRAPAGARPARARHGRGRGRRDAAPRA